MYLDPNFVRNKFISGQKLHLSEFFESCVQITIKTAISLVENYKIRRMKFLCIIVFLVKGRKLLLLKMQKC